MVVPTYINIEPDSSRFNIPSIGYVAGYDLEKAEGVSPVVESRTPGGYAHPVQRLHGVNRLRILFKFLREDHVPKDNLVPLRIAVEFMYQFKTHGDGTGLTQNIKDLVGVVEKAFTSALSGEC